MSELPLMELASFCRHRRIRSLALFGSYLYGNTHLNSDIDLLVEYEPGQRVGLFAMAEMESEISRLLKRTVDLRTAQDLSIYFRDRVLAEARVLYES